jgi:hypothetical protein
VRIVEGRLSQLPKSKRIVGTQRDELAKSLKEQYERGVSIRTLAATTGRSFGFIHTLLLEGGVAMRARGGSRPRTKASRR